MRKFVVPIIFIIVAGFMVFGLSGPVLEKIKVAKQEKATLTTGLENAREVQKELDVLLQEFNQLSQNDIKKLDTLIPETIDNVKLVIDINDIATNYGMTIRDIKIQSEERDGTRAERTELDNARSALVGSGSMEIGSILIGFSVDGSYRALQLFLQDLARSLRLVDIESLKFTSGEADGYKYDIVLRTYWLK